MIDTIMLIFKITLFVFFIYSADKLTFEPIEVNQMRLMHRCSISFCIVAMVVYKLMQMWKFASPRILFNLVPRFEVV